MLVSQLDELIERLNNHAEWAEANIWDVPITLPDDILKAIKILEKIKNEKLEKTKIII